MTTQTGRPARIALVGDRSPTVRSHARIPGLLTGLLERDGLELEAYWVRTDEVSPGEIAEFDGVWLLPGSPYRSEEGALNAVRTARTRGIPFLGTCAGFQHAMVEFARNVCGLADVIHAENGGTGEVLIGPLSCSLVGHEGAIEISAGSLAERVIGTRRSVERYHCAYGLVNPAYLAALVEHGLSFTGHDADGEVRVAELPDHPFFLATLFQPELAGDGSRPHPIVRAYAEAVVRSSRSGAGGERRTILRSV